MMSTETIHHLSEQAARRAKAKSNRPHQINTATINDGAVAKVMRTIPFIGDWRPRGYTLVEHEAFTLPEGWTGRKLNNLWCSEPYLFIDKYGFGNDSRVLSFDELCDLAAANPGLYWAIVEEGQFQVVVAASHVTH